MSDNRRDVELRIRTQDLSTADFTKVSAAVRELTASIEAETTAARQGRISIGELRESMVRLEQAGKGLTGIAAALDRFKDLQGVVQANATAVERNAEQLARYRGELETVDKTTKAHQTNLNRYVRELEQSETKLKSNQAELQRLEAVLTAANVDTKNLADAENQLRQVADQLGPALTKLNEAQLAYSRNAREAKEAAAALAAEQRAAAAEAKKAADEETARQARIRQNLDDAVKAEKAKNAELEKVARNLAAERIRVAKDTEDKERQNQARLIRAAIDANEKKAQSLKALEDSVTKFNKEQSEKRIKQYQEEQARVRKILDEMRNPLPSPGGRSAGGAGGLFGLRPYELQNLSYQVNDVITQLGSGTNLTQVIAQQGGQILQLFNRNIFTLTRYIPLLAAAGAAAAVAIGAMKHAMEDQASVRSFSGLLQAQVSIVGQSGEALNAIQRNVKQFGVSFEDAGNLIKKGLGAGVAQGALKDFIQTAQAISDVTGDKLEDAFTRVVESFKKGVTGVAELNSSYDFLTVKQFETIKGLYDTNRAAEAQNLTFSLLSQRYIAAAKTAVSPFTEATRHLKTAWDDLLTTLGNSEVIQGLVKILTGFVNILDSAVQKIDKAVEEFKKIPLVAKMGAFGGIGVAASYGYDYLVNQSNKPSTTGAAGGGIEPPAGLGIGAGLDRPISSDRVNVGAHPTDAAGVRALLQALTEAVKELPDGISARIGSTTDHNMRVKRADGTFGDISQHYYGKAIDVHLVDKTGREIPGSMGAGGPAYDQLDAAMQRALARLYPGAQLTPGSTFRPKDAGHFAISGDFASSAQAVAGAQELVSQNQEKQRIAGQQLLTQDALRLAQANDFNEANVAVLRNLTGQIARQEALDQKLGEAVAKQHEAAALQEFDTKQLERKNRIAEEDRIRRIQDGKYADQIAAAGQRAAQAAIDQAKAGQTSLSFDQLRAAQIRGETELRDTLQKKEQARESDRNITNQLAQLNRANELKDTFTLQNRLEGVANQYKAIRQAIEKHGENYGGLGYPSKTAISDIDAAEAQAKANEEAKFRLEQLNQLVQERNTLISTYNTLVEKGLMTTAEAETKIKELYETTSPKITEATEAFQKFIDTNKLLDPNKVALYTAKIKELNAEAKYTSPLFKAIKDSFTEGLAQGLSQGFNTIAEAIGGVIAKTKSWKDVLDASKTAVGQLFATLLKDIAEAILKYEALKLASAITGVNLGGARSSAGGFLGSIVGALFGSGAGAAGVAGAAGTGVAAGGGGIAAGVALLAHNGGIIGRDNFPLRATPGSSWWDSAPRYHDGTVVGLSRGEHRAILKEGEEVLSENNPRNILNMMKGGGGGLNIKSILLMDPDLIPSAMTTAPGEAAVMSTIKKNIPTIRQFVKG